MKGLDCRLERLAVDHRAVDVEALAASVFLHRDVMDRFLYALIEKDVHSRRLNSQAMKKKIKMSDLGLVTKSTYLENER